MKVLTVNARALLSMGMMAAVLLLSQQAMAQGIGRDGMDILGQNMITSLQPGVGTCRDIEGDGTAWAGTIFDPERQFRIVASRFMGGDDQFHQIVFKFRGKIEIEHLLPRPEHISLGDGRF